MSDGERVRLVLPGDGQFVRVARVAATVLMRDHGFNVREVDELQRALGDTLRGLLDSAGAGSRVELLYETTDGEIGIEIRFLRADGTPEGPPHEVRRRRAAQPV